MISLNLTKEEAEVLMLLLNNVAGPCKMGKRRYHASSMRDKLVDLIGEREDLYFHESIQGTLLFND